MKHSGNTASSAPSAAAVASSPIVFSIEASASRITGVAWIAAIRTLGKLVTPRVYAPGTARMKDICAAAACPPEAALASPPPPHGLAAGVGSRGRTGAAGTARTRDIHGQRRPWEGTAMPTTAMPYTHLG